MAAAIGDPAAGIRRAFTLTLAPWSREQSRRPLPPDIAERFYVRSFLSIHYHVAAVVALLLLFSSPFWREFPAALAPVAGAFLFFGFIIGIVFFLMRVFDRRLRAISIPDDYISLLLVNALVLTAIAATFFPGALPAFQVTGGVVLLYAPLGKIRHMVFCLASLWEVGKHYGRRGVRPRPQKHFEVE